MTLYTTCYGLTLSNLAMDRNEAIELRVTYIFIAAVISIFYLIRVVMNLS